MKKYILFLCLIGCIGNVVAQNTFTIGSGAIVTVSGNGQSVLNGVNLVNNGAYKDTSGTFVTIGSNIFSGSGITNLNNYTINSTGTVHVNSLVSVLHTANLASDTMQANGNLYIRSDQSTLANMFVTGELVGGVQGIIARPSGITGTCPAYTSILTLDISGPAMLYQWQQSADSASWTNITGATSGSYMADVTAANIYYRCQLATNNSSFSQNTPGVKLNLSMGTTLAGVITGPSILCQGTAIVLSESLSGGTWSSNNTSVATVSAAGIVTGVSGGIAVISYSITNACGTVSSTKTITVNPAPNAGVISGSAAVCNGATTTLSSSVSGGTWTSGSPGTASVTATGLVTGLSVGTAVISYTAANSCGTAVATYTIAVNPLPNAGSIGGLTVVYTGSMITLTDAAAGGIWSSSNGSIATVTGAGVVSGIAAGGVTISYSVTNSCGTAVATFPITVSVLSGSGSGAGTGPGGSGAGAYFVISGGAFVKGQGNDQVVMNGMNFKNNGNYTDSAGMMTTFGGIAFSGAGSTWLNNLNVNSTGRTDVNSLVSVNNTTDLIHDTLNAGNNVFVRSDVNAAANMIVNTELTNTVKGIIVKVATAGGACDTAVLSLNISGPPVQYHWQMSADSASWSDISGATLAAYTPTVSGTNYYRCHLTASNSSFNESTPGVKRNVLLSVQGSIAGVNTICSGTATTLTDSYSGGVWSSSNPAVASVGVMGTVTGVSGGTAVISYYWDLGCVALDTFTVNQSPSPITGTMSTCTGTTTALTDAVTGGTWSSGSPAIATVGSTGIVTGAAGGTATITYTTGGACNASAVVTINTVAAVAPVTGVTNICIGSGTVLSDVTPGGFWFSSNPSIATITAGGLVTGVGSGSAVLNYAVANVCGVNESFITINVAAPPASIGGLLSACVGALTSLNNTTPGGTWTSGSPAIATIGSGSGVVNGISAGTSAITYATSPACFVSSVVTINPLPGAGTISGAATVAVGASISLLDIAGGGVWSSGSAGIASVGSSGIVTGISAGTATISYTVTNGCGSASALLVVTVTPAGADIAPTFISSSPQMLTVCQDGGATPINSLLTVSDLDAGQTETWSIASSPSHGTLGGFSTTASSGSASITPSGLTYTPSAGYFGPDAFTIQVSDGTATATMTVNVVVNAIPVAGAAYTQVFNTSGTVAYGGVSVTATSSGSVSTFAPCGSETSPYLFSGGVGTYSFSFSSTVSSVKIPVIFGSSGVAGSLAISINGVHFPIAPCNIVGNAITSCGDLTLAIISGGDLTNPPSDYGGLPNATVLISGAINSVSLTNSGTDAIINGLYFGPTNISPTFDNGSPQALIVCENSGGNAINSLLTVTDPDAAQTETWSVVTGPANGVLSGFTATAGSGGSGIIPAGLTYTPNTGYSGTDAFTILVDDGAGGTATTTINVTVNPLPNAGTVSGTSFVCVGSNVSLTDGVAGGIWSSSTPANGTVSAGMVTGISPGITTISYTVTNGCGSTAATLIVTVSAMPDAGSISGSTSVCAGSALTLTDGAPFGAWSSSNTAVGTVSGGVVAGLTAGTTTISFTAINSCGTAVSTLIITVNPSPSATITNIVPMCVGGSVILYVTPSGGGDTYFWSGPGGYTSTVQNASVFPAATATFSLTVSNSATTCSSLMYTTVVTVNPTPVAAPTNSGPVCSGGGSVTLMANPGGGANAFSWSGPSGFSSTLQNPIFTTTATGTYSLIVSSSGYSGCTPTWLVYTTTVTVSAPVPAISGLTNVCVSVPGTLTDATSGGTWSSSNVSIATIGSASGTLNGVAAGTATITYVVPGGCFATTIVTVNTTATGTISGPSTVNVGSNITLTDAVGGGTWSASNGNVTVSGGLVTGVSVGTVTISYSVTGSCGTASATKLVSVGTSTVAISAITGYYFYLCAGATAPFFDATGGGIWGINPADAAVASVSGTGVVTGISAGTARLSYTVGLSSATAVVTVYPVPAAIIGAGNVCIGQTTALTDASAGGVWSSSVPSYASIGTSGIVTGIIAGTVPMYYTFVAPAGCRAAFIVTVNPNPAGISGPTSVCAGSSIQLTDMTSGGVWSSTSTNITVDGSGSVTGIAAGSATVTYTMAGCYRTYNVGVNVATAGAISGASSVTVGLNITLTDAMAGGTWSASNSNATVSGAGLVTGVAAGTVTISYTVSGSCGVASATYVVTVNASGVSDITGTPGLCVGATTALTDATPGGTWHSSNTFIATVGTSGIVTGVAAGTAAISYIVVGVPATVVVTVSAAPSAIGGATSVCNGSAITLSDFTAGGTWTSTAGVSVTNGTTVTTVTGLTNGTNTITYSIGTGCFRTFAVTVKALPAPILGNLNVCGVGAVTFLSDATAGTSWIISPAGTATISPSGRVYGVSVGTATVTYTASNGCVTTAVATVNAAVTVAAISGANNVSHGATITLSDITPGGIWSSSNSALGSVDALGDVTGVGTSGTVTISYTLPYAGGGCNALATKAISVHTPAPHIHGTATTTVGATVGIAAEAMGGEWTTSDNTIAVVDANGTVTGIKAGTVNITHTATWNDGTISTTEMQVIVSARPFELRVLPNPNKGTFTVSGLIGSDTDEELALEITNMLGQVVYSGKITATHGIINGEVLLNNDLVNGMYLLDVSNGSDHKVIHFVMEK